MFEYKGKEYTLIELHEIEKKKNKKNGFVWSTDRIGIFELVYIEFVGNWQVGQIKKEISKERYFELEKKGEDCMIDYKLINWFFWSDSIDFVEDVEEVEEEAKTFIDIAQCEHYNKGDFARSAHLEKEDGKEFLYFGDVKIFDWANLYCYYSIPIESYLVALVKAYSMGEFEEIGFNPTWKAIEMIQAIKKIRCKI